MINLGYKKYVHFLKTIGRLPQMKQEGLDNSIQKTTLSTVMAIKGETVTVVK